MDRSRCGSQFCHLECVSRLACDPYTTCLTLAKWPSIKFLAFSYFSFGEFRTGEVHLGCSSIFKNGDIKTINCLCFTLLQRKSVGRKNKLFSEYKSYWNNLKNLEWIYKLFQNSSIFWAFLLFTTNLVFYLICLRTTL